MQDAQLMQASGIQPAPSMIGAWLPPATNSTNSQGTACQGAKGPSRQGLQVHKSGTIHTRSYAQTNKHMYNWILFNTCSSIDLFCN